MSSRNDQAKFDSIMFKWIFQVYCEARTLNPLRLNLCERERKQRMLLTSVQVYMNTSTRDVNVCTYLCLVHCTRFLCVSVCLVSPILISAAPLMICHKTCNNYKDENLILTNQDTLIPPATNQNTLIHPATNQNTLNLQVWNHVMQ